MTTASKVTLARLLLIPFFLFFMLTDIVPYSHYIALAFFLLAATTDGVDGYIARKYNQVTDFGKFIDPLADKILVISALICMVQWGWISAIAVIIIVAREFMVTGLRLAAVCAGKVIAAGASGKIKTVVQIVVIALVLFFQEFAAVSQAISIGLTCLVWLMVLITAYSGIEYMVKNWEVLHFDQ